MLNDVSTVAFLCHNLNSKLSKLPDMAVPDFPNPGELLNLE